MLRKCTSKFSMLETNVEKRRIMSDYSYTKCIYFILNYRRNTAQTFNIHQGKQGSQKLLKPWEAKT